MFETGGSLLLYTYAYLYLDYITLQKKHHLHHHHSIIITSIISIVLPLRESGIWSGWPGWTVDEANSLSFLDEQSNPIIAPVTYLCKFTDKDYLIINSLPLWPYIPSWGQLPDFSFNIPYTGIKSIHWSLHWVTAKGLEHELTQRWFNGLNPQPLK